jgi:hypothetical protein
MDHLVRREHAEDAGRRAIAVFLKSLPAQPGKGG